MLKPDAVVEARSVTRQIYCDPRLRDYAVSIVQATRSPSQFGLAMDDLVEIGASPRHPWFGGSSAGQGVLGWTRILRPPRFQIDRAGSVASPNSGQL